MDDEQLDLLAPRPKPAPKPKPLPRFNGSDYDYEKDHDRISKQHERVRESMRDGVWRTLGEIAALTGDPESSISAQLRHLRKPRFGTWTVDKRRRGEGRQGLWEYQLWR